jgi:hypothetical protein
MATTCQFVSKNKLPIITQNKNTAKILHFQSFIFFTAFIFVKNENVNVRKKKIQKMMHCFCVDIIQPPL